LHVVFVYTYLLICLIIYCCRRDHVYLSVTSYCCTYCQNVLF